MTLLPQVRGQLDAAAHRKVATIGRTRGYTPVGWDVAPIGRRTRSAMNAVGMALLVSCSLAIVLGAVVLLHAHHARPAANAAGSGPHAAPGAAAQPLLRTLGALRRAQTKADLDPRLLRIVDGRRALWAVGTPDVSLIRLATVTPWGSKVFLVPYKPLTVREIAKLPAQLRALAWRTLRRQGRAETVATLEVGGPAGGGVCCASATEINRIGDSFWAGGPGSAPTRGVVVVPDGVSDVTLMLARVRPGGRADKLSATVHNNVAAFEIGRGVNNPFQDMTWYGPGGHVIKRISKGRVLPAVRPRPDRPAGSHGRRA
jgi:hypothetical protein